LNPEAETRPLESFSIGDWRVEHWASLVSTSDRGRELALRGHPGRIWIVADEQTSGRGRQGRTWSSPPGNLHASALIVDPCEISVAAQLGFVAGVAARRAVADLGVDARLKWPNDLVVNGAKLAGLLVEGVTPPGRRLAAIVGIGVNVASSPQGLAYPTASLARCLGAPRTARALFERLARRFEEALGVWNRGAGFAAIRETWLASAAGLGGHIRVVNAHGGREGTFEGLDMGGRLLFKRDGVVETIESADIILIPPNSGAAPCQPQ
jgi:BirA family biotin operon repressor/biotin-[acetyl-CoA-carboxylase] ligase